MTAITRDWLQKTIAEFENTRDDIPFGLDDDDAKILIVLKRALAACDAQPVAWTDAEELRDLAKDGYGAMLSIGNCKGADPRRQILLFTHPAPLRDAERQELERRIAEMKIESSVKDAAIIELKQQYSRLQEARYNSGCRTPVPDNGLTLNVESRKRV